MSTVRLTRQREKKLCAEISSAAEALTRSGLNHAELYMGRARLAQAIAALVKPPHTDTSGRWRRVV